MSLGAARLGLQQVLRFAKPYVKDAVGAVKPIISPVINKLSVPVTAGAAIGGLKGGMQDGLGGAVGGALGGGMLGAGVGAIPAVGGMGALAQGALAGTAGLYGPATMGITGRAGGTALGAGALQMQNVPNVPLTGAVPQFQGAHGQMVAGPGGTIQQQLDPLGYQQGLRMGSGMDAMQAISNQNRYFNALLPQWNEVERRNLERQVAAKQLGSNIDLARQLAGNQQISNLNIAQDQAKAMGGLFSGTRTYF